MTSPSAGFIAESQLFVNVPISLVEVDISSAVTLYLALWDTNVVFDGNTYTPIRGQFTPVPKNVELEAPSLALELDNITLEWTAYITNNDLQGRDITIKTVFEDQLDDSDAFVSSTYAISSYGLSPVKAVFQLASKFNILRITLPRRMYGQYFCPWRYRDTETCRYSYKVGETYYVQYGEGTIKHIGLSSCDKTFDSDNGCSKHFPGFQSKRFGAYPSRIAQAWLDS